MDKYYWIVNLDRCIGCETCVIACKQENQTIEGVQYRRVYQINPELYPHHPTFRISLGCNHCENPACLPACPVHAYEQKDGIVLHNPELCIGCQYCLWVCPFDVPQYAVAKGRMEKCNLCQRRLNKGMMPACVDACPTGAIKLVERLDEARNAEYHLGKRDFACNQKGEPANGVCPEQSLAKEQSRSVSIKTTSERENECEEGHVNASRKEDQNERHKEREKMRGISELKLPETIPGFPEGKTRPKIRMITRRRLGEKGGDVR